MLLNFRLAYTWYKQVDQVEEIFNYFPRRHRIGYVWCKVYNKMFFFGLEQMWNDDKIVFNNGIECDSGSQIVGSLKEGTSFLVLWNFLDPIQTDRSFRYVALTSICMRHPDNKSLAAS